jgi:isochorismate synthase
LFAGAPRGFWGRGDRWVAWGGALLDLQVPAPEAEPLAPVIHEVREALGALRPFQGQGVPAPRLFGGFAFASGAGGDFLPADPAWEGFPAARFILPEWMLEGEGEAAQLILHWIQPSAPSARGGPSRPPSPLPSSEARLRVLAERLVVAGMADGVPSSNGGTPALGVQPEGLRAPGDADMGAHAVPADGHGQAMDRGGEDGSAQDTVAKGAWAAAVDQILVGIRRGELEKAVLARILDVDLSQPTCAPEVLSRLRRENRRAHVFLFEPDPGRILLGAAPEILAELRGGRFHATAVAGSISRGADADADSELAARLRASGKDMEEHRHTVEVMREALTPLVSQLEVDPEPGVLTLARIQHLETGFRGRTNPGVDILSLVEALHPTPAVCGRPLDRALELIRRCEPFHRGWYSGPVGWVDTAGEGDFVPALRSAVGHGARWRLFAGAGIVEGSDPGLEWEETGLKFEPALRALGVGAS